MWKYMSCRKIGILLFNEVEANNNLYSFEMLRQISCVCHVIAPYFIVYVDRIVLECLCI